MDRHCSISPSLKGCSVGDGTGACSDVFEESKSSSNIIKDEYMNHSYCKSLSVMGASISVHLIYSLHIIQSSTHFFFFFFLA